MTSQQGLEGRRFSNGRRQVLHKQPFLQPVQYKTCCKPVNYTFCGQVFEKIILNHFSKSLSTWISKVENVRKLPTVIHYSAANSKTFMSSPQLFFCFTVKSSQVAIYPLFPAVFCQILKCFIVSMHHVFFNNLTSLKNSNSNNNTIYLLCTSY